MEDKKFLQSKKSNGMLIGLAAGLLASAAAVASGPTGISVLPTVLTFIATITGANQFAQGAQDVANIIKGKSDKTELTQSSSISQK
jgi:primosomal replication protein N